MPFGTPSTLDQTAIRLEFKTQAEPHIERVMIQTRLQEIRIWLIGTSNKVKLEILVRTRHLAAVEDVEEIGREFQACFLRQSPGIIRVNVKSRIERSASLA